MELTECQIVELKEMILKSLSLLYEKDVFLIKNKTKEESIVFRFGLYFSKLLESSTFNEKPEIVLDFDYNRRGSETNPKSIEDRPNIVPDVILHTRGTHDTNIMVIECKTKKNRSNEQREQDYHKLEQLTIANETEEYNYNYGLGVFIDFYPELQNCDIKYWIDGKREAT